MRLTLVLLVDLPEGGAAAFTRYEALVLPLLPRHGGRLERRLRSTDGRSEVHVVSFADRAGYEAYLADPERRDHRAVLAGVEPEQRLLEVHDVPDEGVGPYAGEVRVTGGVRIALRTWGAPDAPPIVLLHALGDDASSWDEVAPRFAEWHHVVAVDLRGHGASDRPGQYAFEQMRDDVLDVLDRLGLRDVVLVGHSLGGVVAYLVAYARPDLLARLVVEDAPPPYPRDRPVPERPEGDLPFDWAVVPAVLAQVDDPSRRWWGPLPQLATPTLVIGGGPGSTIPQHLLAEVVRALPDGRLVTLPVGHEVHAAVPEAYVQVVMGWLGER